MYCVTYAKANGERVRQNAPCSQLDTYAPCNRLLPLVLASPVHTQRRQSRRRFRSCLSLQKTQRVLELHTYCRPPFIATKASELQQFLAYSPSYTELHVATAVHSGSKQTHEQSLIYDLFSCPPSLSFFRRHANFFVHNAPFAGHRPARSPGSSLRRIAILFAVLLQLTAQVGQLANPAWCAVKVGISTSAEPPYSGHNRMEK